MIREKGDRDDAGEEEETCRSISLEKTRVWVERLVLIGMRAEAPYPQGQEENQGDTQRGW